MINMYRGRCRGSRGGTLESVGCDFSDTCTYIHINTYVRVTDTYVHTWQSRSHCGLWSFRYPYVYVCVYIHNDLSNVIWYIYMWALPWQSRGYTWICVLWSVRYLHMYIHVYIYAWTYICIRGSREHTLVCGLWYVRYLCVCVCAYTYKWSFRCVCDIFT